MSQNVMPLKGDSETGPPVERDEKRWYMDADTKADFEIMKTRLEKILARSLTQSEFVALLNSREEQILELFREPEEVPVHG